MDNHILFDGNKFISANTAALSSGLSRDYVARLCRERKVIGRQIGTYWYVSEESFNTFLMKQRYAKQHKRDGLAEEWTKEYRSAISGIAQLTPAISIMHTSRPEAHALLSRTLEKHSDRLFVGATRAASAPAGFAHAALSLPHLPAHVVAPLTELLQKLTALTLALMLTFGTYALVDPQYARYATNTLVNDTRGALHAYHSITSGNMRAFAASIESHITIGAEHPDMVASAAAAVALESFARLARTVHANVDAVVYSIAFPERMVQSLGFVSTSRASVIARVVPTAPATTAASDIDMSTRSSSSTLDYPHSYAGSTTARLSAVAQTTTASPIVERVVERQTVLAAGGITEDILNTRLQELDNKLSAKMFNLTSAYSSSPYVPTPIITLAQSTRIDTLSGVSLSHSTWTGGSITDAAITGGSVAASTLSGAVAVSNGGTGTTTAPTYGQLLLGNAQGGYDLVATSSLGISGTASSLLSSENTWTALQLFSAGASTTDLSVFDTLAVGSTATTTILGTATSTFGAGIQATALNVTSSTATSTFANGINISNGCFSVNGTCLTGGAGASTWGSITGTLSSQTDLQAALDARLSLFAWYATTTDALAEGSNLYYTSARATTSFIGNLAATTSVASITALPNLSLPYAQLTGTPTSMASSTLLGDSNTFSGTNAFANITATGATSTSLAVTGITSALHLANSTGGVIAYTGSSCTNQFIRSLNGAGVATCASVDLVNDTTGTLTVGKGGTGANSFGQGWLYSSGGTGALAASTSPTVNSLVSTSTTATSSFAGPLEVAGLNTGPYFFGAGLSVCSGSNKLTWSGGSFGCAIDQTGGGSGGGAWSTTTSQVGGQLINYPNNSSDIVAIGNNATTTASYWFDPNTLIAYLSGKVGIGTSTPVEKLSVQGNQYTSGTAFFGGAITATSSLSVAGNTILANATSSSFAITGIASSLLKTNSSGSVVAAVAGTDYLNSTGGDWTGTFDGQEGSYYLNANNLTNFGVPFYSYFSATTTDALAQGSTNRYYSDSLVNTYLHASTTLAKTYTANTFTALQSFSNASSTAISGTISQFTTASSTNLTISSIASGSLLKTTTAGAVTAAVAGTDYAAPTSGTSILLGNGSGGYSSYTGSSCTNQFIRSLNGAGVATCASVQDEDLNLTDITLADFTNDANYAKTSVANTWTALQTFTNASSTVASVYNALYVGSTATTTILGTATSTFGAGIETAALNVTSSTATSTFANGINISNGCFSVNGTCLSSGGSSAWPFTPTTAFGQSVQSTTTALWLNASGYSLLASSSVQFGTAGGSQFFWDGANSRLGIGTTSPWKLLSVEGDVATNHILPNGPYTTNLSSYDLGATGNRWNALWAGTLNIGTSTFSIKSDTASNLGFFTAASGGGTQMMTLTSGGNVGIATTSPLAKLDVYGDAIFSGASRYLNFGAISGTSGYGFRDNNGTIEFKNSGGTWQGVTTATSGPAFSVNKNGTNQTVTASTWTKLTWSTEVFDTNNNFASDKFTPTVPGKYIVNVHVMCASVNGFCLSAIYKNGSAVVWDRARTSVGSDEGSGVSTIIDMNGSTDYLEAYGYTDSTTINGAGVETNFSGALLAPVNGNNVANWQYDGTQTTLLDSTKLVGIGTTTPWSKLAIQNNYGSTLTSLFSVASSTAANGSSAATFFNITNAGSVGIGTTTPWGSLAVSTAAQQSGTIPLLNIASTTNTSLFTVLGNGNVGVGTTSPLAKLDVYGDAILSGASRYLNFGAISGTTGYGIRDNAGTMEYKNSAGAWAGIGSGGGAFPFTPTTNFGTAVNATTSILWFQNGLHASSTSRLANVAFDAGGYANFGATTGSSGYGFRDNNGTIEFKNSGGTWQGVTTATSGPSFFVQDGSAQSIPNATLTKVTFGTEVFDTNNNFASSKFTPTVPGKYILTGEVALEGGTIVDAFVIIYKNGSVLLWGSRISGVSSTGIYPNVSAIVDANGSTDYFELYVYQISGGSHALVNDVARNYFTGAMIAPVSPTAGGWQNDNTQSILADSMDLVGIGTSTPWSKLSIQNNYGSTLTSLFSVASSTAANGSTATTFFNITNAGSVGIGTTSPWAKLAVHANNGDTNTTLFAIASSTASATTTLFSVSNTGTVLANHILPNGPYTTNLSSYDLGATSQRWNALWAGTLNVGTSTFSISSDTASNLGFFTAASGAGTQVMTLTSGGNVGIGTTSPSTKLDIVNTGITDTRYRVRNDTVGGDVAVDSTKFFVGPYTNHPLVFLTNNSERMRIDNSGNVGIGTMSPGRPLHVMGAKVTDGGDSNSVLRLQDTSAYNAAPQAGIVFAGYYNSSSATAPWASITGPKENATDGNYAGALTFHTRPNSGNLTERMRVDSNGNVGIGTTSPLSQLSVASSTQGFINIGAPNGNGARIIFGDVSTTTTWVSDNLAGLFRLYNSSNVEGSAGSVRMAIDYRGNVGIGTTNPTYQLQLSTDSAGKPNGGSWSNSSDERLKTDIVSIENGLERLLKLQPVSFDWRNPDIHGGATSSAGFIAQNVKAEFPAWVTDTPCVGADCALVGGATTSTAYSLTLPFEFDAMVVSALRSIGTIAGTFKSALVAWFADAGNGIGDFFANRVRTKELCVSDVNGETCITRAQLDALLSGSTGSPQAGQTAAAAVAPQPATSPPPPAELPSTEPLPEPTPPAPEPESLHADIVAPEVDSSDASSTPPTEESQPSVDEQTTQDTVEIEVPDTSPDQPLDSQSTEAAVVSPVTESNADSNVGTDATQ